MKAIGVFRISKINKNIKLQQYFLSITVLSLYKRLLAFKQHQLACKESPDAFNCHINQAVVDDLPQCYIISI